MTLKFLKPDKRKILVFAILLISLAIFPFNPVNVYCAGDIEGVGPQCPKYSFEPLFTILTRGFDYYLGFENSIHYVYNPIFLLIYIFLFYLLSCLIVWIYDKFRKKKK
jgi:hypothetical protein